MLPSSSPFEPLLVHEHVRALISAHPFEPLAHNPYNAWFAPEGDREAMLPIAAIEVVSG
jgi:hypothetical protein